MFNSSSEKKAKEPMSATTKQIIAASLAAVFGLGAVGTYRSTNVVPPKSFGLRVTAGKVQDKLLEPGIAFTYPVLDTIYAFSNNVIILETTAGSARNTQDQNTFSAQLRLHYQIDPNAGVLAFHLDEMGKENGEALVTEQMNKAIDAIVGQRTTGQVLSSHADILKDFVAQLEWRLKQNNIAVKIDTVEYLSANMGAGVRLPVQLRVKPGQAVESMAGPSAVPVSKPTAEPR